MINLDRVCSALVDAGFSNEEIIEVKSKLLSKDNYSFSINVDERKNSYTAKEIFGVDENQVNILNATMNSVFEKYYDIAKKNTTSEENFTQKLDVLDLISEVMGTYTIKDLEMSTFHYVKKCFYDFCEAKMQEEIFEELQKLIKEHLK